MNTSGDGAALLLLDLYDPGRFSRHDPVEVDYACEFSEADGLSNRHDLEGMASFRGEAPKPPFHEALETGARRHGAPPSPYAATRRQRPGAGTGPDKLQQQRGITARQFTELRSRGPLYRRLEMALEQGYHGTGL
jgi:hypothetical protein